MVCQRTAYELIKYAKGFLKHTLIEMDLVGMYLSLRMLNIIILMEQLMVDMAEYEGA